MSAAERISESWSAFVEAEKLPCPVNVAVHQGMLYAFRSYLYGPGIEIAFRVEAASHAVLGPHEGAVFVTGEVRSRLAGRGRPAITAARDDRDLPSHGAGA
jgi:hypothetical protein